MGNEPNPLYAHSSLPPSQHACVSYTLRNIWHVRAPPPLNNLLFSESKEDGGTENEGRENGGKSQIPDL